MQQHNIIEISYHLSKYEFGQSYYTQANNGRYQTSIVSKQLKVPAYSNIRLIHSQQRQCICMHLLVIIYWAIVMIVNNYIIYANGMTYRRQVGNTKSRAEGSLSTL